MPDSPSRLTSPRRTASEAVTGPRRSDSPVDRMRREHQSGFVELVRQLQRDLDRLPREFGQQVPRRLPSS